jgi:CBS domain-containing protein
MSSPLITDNPNLSPSVAADMRMLQNNVRQSLVVDNDEKSSLNKPVDIITPRNFKKSRT